MPSISYFARDQLRKSHDYIGLLDVEVLQRRNMQELDNNCGDHTRRFGRPMVFAQVLSVTQESAELRRST